MRDVNELATNAGALSVIYATSCECYMASVIKSELRPDNHRLAHEMMSLWTARDYCWRELLAAVNRLRDAGEDVVASRSSSPPRATPRSPRSRPCVGNWAH